MWDIESRTAKHQFFDHEAEIYNLYFARNNLLASCGEDRRVYLYDLNQNRQILKLYANDVLTSVAISPDNCFVVAGSFDKSAWVWDIETGELVARLEGHTDKLYSIEFSPTGDSIITGSLDNTIKAWQLPRPKLLMPDDADHQPKCIRTFKGHTVSLSQQYALALVH